MKRYNYIYALTLATVFMTACQDEDIVKSVIKPAEIGEEILFGARAGFENANKTRTVYGEESERYVVEGVTYEMVKWVDQDKIQIYSNEATSPNVDESDAHTAHYVVNIAADDKTPNQYAYLTGLHETSLQWGQGMDENGTHIFYAMYPSAFMFGSTDTDNTTTYPSFAESVGMSGSTINGFVDYSQPPLRIEKTGNDYVAVPNMKFAYMAAKTTTSRKEAYEVDEETGETKGVNLTFYPIVTAVEIEMTLAESASGSGTGVVNPINIGEIQVAGENIAGAFTAELDEWTGIGVNGIKTVADATSAYNYINVSTYQTVDGKLVPTTVQPGGSLTFTVFLKPGETDVNDLAVRISDYGATWQNKALEDITIQTKKKNILTNLKLPITAVEINNSIWMSQLDGKSLLGRLSLPGTGQSFSYLNGDSYNGDNDYYKAQTISFEDQWALGIRAFEITCSRHNASTGDLGTLNVMCNNKSVGKTVREVFDMILASDDDPATTEAVTGGMLTPSSDETAMVIISYQPGGGQDADRNPSYFIAQFNTLYNNLVKDYPNRFVRYSPTLTLDDRVVTNDDGTTTTIPGARGKVMIVLRPTQLDEDDSSVRAAALTAAGDNPVLVIDGCGTGKDKWGRRRYKIGNSYAADIRDAATGAPVLETYYHVSHGHWLTESYPEASATTLTWPDASSITKTEKGYYSYATNDTTYNIWYQEWARVVEKEFKVMFANVGAVGIGIYSYANYYHWLESYAEKEADVINAFDMAINDTYKDSLVFINSLSGYLLDETLVDSYSPYMTINGVDWSGRAGGQAGRIGALATKLNEAFYQHVLTAGMNSKTGPTGIVMMDRVSNNQASGGASYILPSVIIANNFKSGSGGNVAPPEDPNTPPTDPEVPGGGNQGGVEG